MTAHSAAYERYLSELLTTPVDSVDHHVAAAVAAIQDDNELATLLIAMYLQDPVSTREFALACHLLSLLFPSTPEQAVTR